MFGEKCLRDREVVLVGVMVLVIMEGDFLYVNWLIWVLWDVLVGWIFWGLSGVG